MVLCWREGELGLYRRLGLVLSLGERLGLVVVLQSSLARELYRCVLYGGRGAGLELHVGQDSVHQLDVLTLLGHEVAALGVAVGDHVLVGQESVHVTAV